MERWTGAVGEIVTEEGGKQVLVAEIVGGKGYGWACLGAAVACGVVGIWVSDLFWRGVDRQSVRAARWVEGLVVRR